MHLKFYPRLRTLVAATCPLLAELPQSVRVLLTSDLLKDNGITNLNHAPELSSGIARQSNLGQVFLKLIFSMLPCKLLICEGCFLPGRIRTSTIT